MCDVSVIHPSEVSEIWVRRRLSLKITKLVSADRNLSGCITAVCTSDNRIQHNSYLFVGEDVGRLLSQTDLTWPYGILHAKGDCFSAC